MQSFSYENLFCLYMNENKLIIKTLHLALLLQLRFKATLKWSTAVNTVQ